MSSFKPVRDFIYECIHCGAHVKCGIFNLIKHFDEECELRPTPVFNLMNLKDLEDYFKVREIPKYNLRFTPEQWKIFSDAMLEIHEKYNPK